MLQDGDGEAKVLAGGQSLVPLMKLRFATLELRSAGLDRRGLRGTGGDPQGTAGDRRRPATAAVAGQPDQLGAAVPDGITVVPISRQSEGALEVHIEPVMPAPHLVIVGRSPGERILCRRLRAWSLRCRHGLATGSAEPARRAAWPAVVLGAGHGRRDVGEGTGWPSMAAGAVAAAGL
jgi:hypothetical protein